MSPPSASATSARSGCAAPAASGRWRRSGWRRRRSACAASSPPSCAATAGARSDRRPASGRRRATRAPERSVVARQLDHETAAAAVAGLATHAAAVARRDLLDERETEADATRLLGMARQTEERLEDALAHRRRHAGAAVADAGHDPTSGAAARLDGQADLDLAAAVA